MWQVSSRTKIGPGKIVEGDGMFVVGKCKCGVGRYHRKEHVQVCLERKSRKVRRIVVRDKSADALSVFAKHLKPNTEMCRRGNRKSIFREPFRSNYSS